MELLGTDLVAGENAAEQIAEDIKRTVLDSYCENEVDFDEEYPGDKPHHYRIMVTIEKLDSPAEEQPYIEKHRVTTELIYNPAYGDNRICECGHTYERHFDSWEMMEACGCKYCSCYTFKEAKKEGE